jgi:hypothetical protein
LAKKPSDPRGGHSRVYWALQDSMAWRALAFSSVALYMALRRKLQSTNNGNIEATITTLRHAGFNGPTTLAKALRELQAVGLIDKTRQGGVAYGQKQCNLFRFTDEATFEHPKLGIAKMPATNEWQKFATLSDATNAIKAAHAAVAGTRPERSKNKLGLQKLYRAHTDSVLKHVFPNTDSVAVPIALEQKVLQRARRKPAANPHEH